MGRININKLIEQKSSEIFEIIMCGRIPINVNLSSDIPEINASEKDIEQMLLNIAIHAEHNIPHGGRLTISTSNIVIKDDDNRVSSYNTQNTYVGISFSYDLNTGTQNPVAETITEGTQGGKGSFADVHGFIERFDGYLNIHNEEGKTKTYNILIPAINNSSCV